MDWTYAFSGAAFGLSAGLVPGPLQALILAEALKHGRTAGMKVGVAPLVTDAPIIAASLLVLSRLQGVDAVLGGLSFVGALFLVYLAVEYFRVEATPLRIEQTAARSLRKGVLTNFLNPYPYLFWLTVGGPLMLAASEMNPWAGLPFLVGFYGVLIACLLGIALLAARSRRFLSSRIYRFVVRALGVVLLLFAGFLLREGWQRIFG